MVSNMMEKPPVIASDSGVTEDDSFQMLNVPYKRRSRVYSDEPMLHELATFRDRTNLECFSDSEETVRIGNQSNRNRTETKNDGERINTNRVEYYFNDEELEFLAQFSPESKKKKKSKRGKKHTMANLKRSQGVERCELILKETMRRIAREDKSSPRSHRRSRSCEDVTILGDDDLLSVSTPKSNSSQESSKRRSKRKSKSRCAPSSLSSPPSSSKSASRRKSSSSLSLSPKAQPRRSSGRSSPRHSAPRPSTPKPVNPTPSSPRSSSPKRSTSPVAPSASSPKPYVTSESSVPYVTSKATRVKSSISRRRRCNSGADPVLRPSVDDNVVAKPTRRRATSQSELLSIDLDEWDIEPPSILRRSASATNTQQLRKRVSFCLPGDDDSDEYDNKRYYQEMPDESFYFPMDDDESDDIGNNRTETRNGSFYLPMDDDSDDVGNDRSYQEIQDDINAVLSFL